MGFKQSHYDYSLFTKLVGDDTVEILVYVNDLLITGNNQQLLCDTRLDIQKKFKMKNLGELKFFLGIEVSRSNKAKYDEHINNELAEDDNILADPAKYQRLIGRLLYLTMTRPVHSQCNSKGSQETRRSVTGYIVRFGRGLISGKSKKQETVSRSSAKAEFRSMTACAAEIT
ncbi:uncharacterized protein LOC107013537 [Solanum pennellii]|uniref:Uncharacterized protein LOC107013537 n=1 Tax=Solanum pennellii TaxID=28526 RepID=A0ABM1GBX3_SOLPN|nr:uncharacterized protein LOC107013537 [Solanum pennellii]